MGWSSIWKVKGKKLIAAFTTGAAESFYTHEGAFKYTVEEWLTSKGKSIDEIGLEPDIEIYNEDDRDLQLVSAINELK